MPFSRMPKPVQKAIDTEAKKGKKTKYKGRRQWLAIYHSARKQGKSKSQAAAMAGGGVKKESHVIDDGISAKEAVPLSKKNDIKSKNIPFDQFVAGANHEIEHKKEVDNSPLKISQIATDHLEEDPEYYKKLSKLESLSLMDIYEGFLSVKRKE